jgi:hypothetical protein
VQHVAFSKPDSLLQIGTLDPLKSGGATALVEYSEYAPVNERKMAMHRMVTINNGGRKYVFDMELVLPMVDVPVDFPFNIPKNYGTK